MSRASSGGQLRRMRMNAGQAAADVHQRRRLEIETASIARAIEARRDQCAETGQANLSAVIVAGEHQIEAVRFGPGKMVGRMGKEDAERGGFRDGPKVVRGCGWSPSQSG